MVRKQRANAQRRKIGRKTVRQMTMWSPYAFKQRLISTARQYENVHVIIVDESYTSKTCGCLRGAQRQARQQQDLAEPASIMRCSYERENK
jgi:transposase